MDRSEVKGLIGKRVIGFNHCFVDENRTRIDWLIETIEAVGEDWVVTRGRFPSLTKLDNVVERLKKELVTEGEQGRPISPSQSYRLFERMAKSLSQDGHGEWTVRHLERYKEIGLFSRLDVLRRHMSLEVAFVPKQLSGLR